MKPASQNKWNTPPEIDSLNITIHPEEINPAEKVLFNRMQKNMENMNIPQVLNFDANFNEY